MSSLKKTKKKERNVKTRHISTTHCHHLNLICLCSRQWCHSYQQREKKSYSWKYRFQCKTNLCALFACKMWRPRWKNQSIGIEAGFFYWLRIGAGPLDRYDSDSYVWLNKMLQNRIHKKIWQSLIRFVKDEWKFQLVPVPVGARAEFGFRDLKNPKPDTTKK